MGQKPDFRPPLHEKKFEPAHSAQISYSVLHTAHFVSFAYAAFCSNLDFDCHWRIIQ